jgi:hypothetical protein
MAVSYIRRLLTAEVHVGSMVVSMDLVVDGVALGRVFHGALRVFSVSCQYIICTDSSVI